MWPPGRGRYAAVRAKGVPARATPSTKYTPSAAPATKKIHNIAAKKDARTGTAGKANQKSSGEEDITSHTSLPLAPFSAVAAREAPSASSGRNAPMAVFLFNDNGKMQRHGGECHRIMAGCGDRCRKRARRRCLLLGAQRPVPSARRARLLRLASNQTTAVFRTCAKQTTPVVPPHVRPANAMGHRTRTWRGRRGLALPCPALPCPALPCPALPCPALPCPAIWIASSLTVKPRPNCSLPMAGHIHRVDHYSIIMGDTSPLG
eukprot:gene25589-biopygen15048